MRTSSRRIEDSGRRLDGDKMVFGVGMKLDSVELFTRFVRS
jgi:hypothetical protein